MPGRWVYRKDLQGQIDSAPLQCFVEGAIVAEPGTRTVGQCIATLLREGEGCEGHGEVRPIRKDRQLVGYIHVSRSHP
jgi:hypothetical protein